MSVSESSQDTTITTYHEEKIGKVLFRVTNVYLGKNELKNMLEELTVKKVMRDVNNMAGCGNESAV